MVMKDSLLINCIHKGILPRTPAGGCTDLPGRRLVGTLLCSKEFLYELGYFSVSTQVPQGPDH